MPSEPLTPEEIAEFRRDLKDDEHGWWEDDVARLLATLDARDRRIAALEADGKRLDWWEASPWLDWGTDAEDGVVYWVIYQVSGGLNDREWTEVARAKTLREALDRAMGER